jgi:ubiquilin
MQQVLNSPFMDQILNDPQLLREFLLLNPRLREILDRHPELNHILNNPQILRQTIAAMRNPNLYRELMRTTDRQLANIETLGGSEAFNLLQRLYRDVQEPLLSPLDGDSSPSSNSDQNNNNNNNSTDENESSELLRGPNTRPLPNPWSGGGGSGGGGQGTPSPPSFLHPPPSLLFLPLLTL